MVHKNADAIQVIALNEITRLVKCFPSGLNIIFGYRGIHSLNSISENNISFRIACLSIHRDKTGETAKNKP